MESEDVLQPLTHRHSNTSAVLMKRKGEPFLAGDLVFAEFPGYSWPALITNVGVLTLQVVTLILEQDEVIDKERAVIFRGKDHLHQIMSVLTEGEQQDFSEASLSLMELAGMGRKERLAIMKMERGQESSEESEGSKENSNREVVAGSRVASGTERVVNGAERVNGHGGAAEVKKLSCDIDDIALPLMGSRFENLQSQLTAPSFTAGFPETALATSEGESEVEVRLPNPAPSPSPSKRKKMNSKALKDEQFIVSAVKLTNQVLENRTDKVELLNGHQLSYDSLKIARERAMIIAGCTDSAAVVSKLRKKSVSSDQLPTAPELTTPLGCSPNQAHVDHLKSLRASQKKALKCEGLGLEIVQTTAKNTSKRVGKRPMSSRIANLEHLQATKAAEDVFNEAAKNLVKDTENVLLNGANQEVVLEEAAKWAALQATQKLADNTSSCTPVCSPKKKPVGRPKRVKPLEEPTEADSKPKRRSAGRPKKSAVALEPNYTLSNNVVQSKENVVKSDASSAGLKKFRETAAEKRERLASKFTAPTETKTELDNCTECKDEPVAETDIPIKTEAISVENNKSANKSRKSKVPATKTPASRKKAARPIRAMTTPNSAKKEDAQPSVTTPTVTEDQQVSAKQVELAANASKSQDTSPTQITEPTTIEPPADHGPLNGIVQNIVGFLAPYYLNLFSSLIKEKMENQIKLDIQKMPRKESDLVMMLMSGNARAMHKKQAYEIISQLVKNSPCKNLLCPELPEVGPDTPPASPQSEPEPSASSRIAENKVIPQTRKRNSNSGSQDVLHNPFPITMINLNEKNRHDYLESKAISKKVVPSRWSHYMRNLGNSSKSKLKSPAKPDTKEKTVSKKSGSAEKTAGSKRRKMDSPKHTQPIKSKQAKNGLMADSPKNRLALLFHIKDIQTKMDDPLKLKQSDAKWQSVSPEKQAKYLSLSEQILALPEADQEIECLALDLYTKYESGESRLNWASESLTNMEKFQKEAKKLQRKDNLEQQNQELSAFNEKLATKLLNAESRKRKRDAGNSEDDPEHTTKKEKGDGAILDFFCLDCFSLDYNPKQYSNCSSCHAIFHRPCLEQQSGDGSQNRLLCGECLKGPICGICRKVGELKTCSQCPHKYHESCVRPHMSSQVITETSFICPYHVCGSCEARPENNIRNFVRCVRCPQSFHENHLPAGCMRISKTHILCFRHHQGFAADRKKKRSNEDSKKRKRKIGKRKSACHKKLPHLNVPFCFQCTFGGDLICCEGCPASFHNKCLPEENRIKEGESSWLCPDCIVGKKAFIGDIVWVKFGGYRWWPCQVLDELDLPDNIFAKPHQPCQFPVICLGTKEFAWINMSRTYSYEDGDKGRTSSSSSTSGMSISFKLAIVEAKELHSQVKPLKATLLQETSSLDKPSSKKPAPFRFIKANMPYSAAMKDYEKQLKLEREPFPCDCTESDKCSAESSCINRVLLTECPPECRWGEQCENRRFQRRQYPVTKLLKTEGRGWGLFTQEDVTPGTLVHEYVGEIIDEPEVERRLHKYQTSGITDYYMLTVENSRIIDAKPKANNARFMNHSCDPNCETQKWNVLGLTCIGLFAKDNIAAGSELTFDYQFDTRGQEKKACLCGAVNCSGFLGVKAKKFVAEQPASKELKKRGKKKKRKEPKVKTEVKTEIKTEVIEAGAVPTVVKAKKPGKPKKAVTLPVKQTKKRVTKGVKPTTKSVLKKTVLEKKISKEDIEEDLQKINEIINNANVSGDVDIASP